MEVDDGKLLDSITMSVDGFIAGHAGDMSWFTEHLRPNPAVGELIEDIGALRVGDHTFRGNDRTRATRTRRARHSAGAGPDRSSC